MSDNEENDLVSASESADEEADRRTKKESKSRGKKSKTRGATKKKSNKKPKKDEDSANDEEDVDMDQEPPPVEESHRADKASPDRRSYERESEEGDRDDGANGKDPHENATQSANPPANPPANLPANPPANPPSLHRTMSTTASQGPHKSTANSFIRTMAASLNSTSGDPEKANEPPPRAVHQFGNELSLPTVIGTVAHIGNPTGKSFSMVTIAVKLVRGNNSPIYFTPPSSTGSQYLLCVCKGGENELPKDRMKPSAGKNERMPRNIAGTHYSFIRMPSVFSMPYPRDKEALKEGMDVSLESFEAEVKQGSNDPAPKVYFNARRITPIASYGVKEKDPYEQNANVISTLTSASGSQLIVSNYLASINGFPGGLAYQESAERGETLVRSFASSTAAEARDYFSAKLGNLVELLSNKDDGNEFSFSKMSLEERDQVIQKTKKLLSDIKTLPEHCDVDKILPFHPSTVNSTVVPFVHFGDKHTRLDTMQEMDPRLGALFPSGEDANGFVYGIAHKTLPQSFVVHKIPYEPDLSKGPTVKIDISTQLVANKELAMKNLTQGDQTAIIRVGPETPIHGVLMYKHDLSMTFGLQLLGYEYFLTKFVQYGDWVACRELQPAYPNEMTMDSSWAKNDVLFDVNHTITLNVGIRVTPEYMQQLATNGEYEATKKLKDEQEKSKPHNNAKRPLQLPTFEAKGIVNLWENRIRVLDLERDSKEWSRGTLVYSVVFGAQPPEEERRASWKDPKLGNALVDKLLRGRPLSNACDSFEVIPYAAVVANKRLDAFE